MREERREKREETSVVAPGKGRPSRQSFWSAASNASGRQPYTASSSSRSRPCGAIYAQGSFRSETLPTSIIRCRFCLSSVRRVRPCSQRGTPWLCTEQSHWALCGVRGVLHKNTESNPPGYAH